MPKDTPKKLKTPQDPEIAAINCIARALAKIPEHRRQAVISYVAGRLQSPTPPTPTVEGQIQTA